MTVTDCNSAVCNADSAAIPSKRLTSGFSLATLQSALNSAITDRDRLAGWWGYVADLLHPPAVLAEQAPAVDQLRRYAHHARWTSSEHGPVRAAGVAWCYLVAVPVTVAARVTEWVWHRPARALVVAATVKALTYLPPIGWAVDHLVIPTVDAALRLFL
jgi:hypothetical protein